MNFRKNSEGGLGVGHKQGYLSMKLIQRGLFRLCLKKLQYNFPKMRRGIKVRLELFQKIIRFGGARLPKDMKCLGRHNLQMWENFNLLTPGEMSGDCMRRRPRSVPRPYGAFPHRRQVS